jgi:hypothetical protein
MKHKLKIPKPSAKRLKVKEFVIESYSGWGGGIIESIPVQEDADEIDFDFKFDEEALNPSIIDGINYCCYFKYQNSTGSRTENIEIDWRKLYNN